MSVDNVIGGEKINGVENGSPIKNEKSNREDGLNSDHFINTWSQHSTGTWVLAIQIQYWIENKGIAKLQTSVCLHLLYILYHSVLIINPCLAYISSKPFIIWLTVNIVIAVGIVVAHHLRAKDHVTILNLIQERYWWVMTLYLLIMLEAAWSAGLGRFHLCNSWW